MTYDKEQTLPENAFEREGYEFIGWSSKKDGTSPEYDNKDTINNLTTENNGIVTIYALWKKTIIITYNANGGTSAPVNQEGVMYNSQTSATIKLTEDIPLKEGNSFLGWTDEQNSSNVKYQPGGAYEFSGDTTLYAIWGTIKYTLTINPNGGTYNGETENTTVTQDYNTTYTVSDPTPPPGYKVTFDGNGGTPASSSLTSKKTFDKWTLSGEGILSGTKYTFCAENVYFD